MQKCFSTCAGLLTLAIMMGSLGCGGPAAETKPEPSKTATATTQVETKAPAATPTPPAVKAPPQPTASNHVILGSDDLTAGIPGTGKLKLEEIKAWLDNPRNNEVLEIELPLGLNAGKGQIKGLDKNPMTRAKIELGRQLYFDPRLSVDNTISCASCHSPTHGMAAETQFGVGVRGQKGDRNSPVAYNRILSDVQFWDGRAETLESQAVGPIANPIEMGHTHDACVTCIEAIPGYKAQFDKVFGKLDIETVAQAIATFERAVVTNPSPFDYYAQLQTFTAGGEDPEDLKNDDPELYQAYLKAKADAEKHPMSDSAVRGFKLFFSTKANCTACHVGANFTDEKYHNLGVGMDKPEPDLGRFKISHDEKDKGAFKTPTIRNIEHTGPYMHDGSQKTLEEVVEWYAKGGHPNPYLSDKVKKLDLTAQDKADLVAFMKACTGNLPKIEPGRLPE